jgi:hypothetical protein
MPFFEAVHCIFYTKNSVNSIGNKNLNEKRGKAPRFVGVKG